MAILDTDYKYYFNVDTREVSTEDNVFFISGDEEIAKIYVILLEQDKNKLDRYISYDAAANYTLKMVVIDNEVYEFDGVPQDTAEATYIFEIPNDKVIIGRNYTCELIVSDGIKKLKSNPFAWRVKNSITVEDQEFTSPDNLNVQYDEETGIVYFDCDVQYDEETGVVSFG